MFCNFYQADTWVLGVITLKESRWWTHLVSHLHFQSLGGTWGNVLKDAVGPPFHCTCMRRRLNGDDSMLSWAPLQGLAIFPTSAALVMPRWAPTRGKSISVPLHTLQVIGQPERNRLISTAMHCKIMVTAGSIFLQLTYVTYPKAFRVLGWWLIVLLCRRLLDILFPLKNPIRFLGRIDNLPIDLLHLNWQTFSFHIPLRPI